MFSEADLGKLHMKCEYLVSVVTSLSLANIADALEGSGLLAKYSLTQIRT